MLDKTNTLDAKTTELIHLVVDGAATPAEIEHFERVIAVSPAARSFFGEMTELKQGLEALPVPAPPPNLVERVIHEIKRIAVPARVIPFRNSSRASGRRNALFFAWAAAAAVVAGIALYPFVTNQIPGSGITPSQAAATMVRLDQETTGEVDGWPLIASARSATTSTASVTVRRLDDRFAVFPTFPAGTHSDVSLRWNREKLMLISATTKLQATAQSDGEVAFSPGKAPHCLIFQKREGVVGPVDVSLMVAGKEAVSTSIDVN